MESAEIGKRSSSRATLVVSAAFVTVILSVAARLSAPGWMLVICGIPLVLLACAHLFVHAKAAVKADAAGGSYLALIGLSDVFCLLGFGLQVDGGDAPGSYAGLITVAKAIFAPGSTASMTDNSLWTNAASLLSYVCLAAMIVTWVILLRRKVPGQSNSEAVVSG